MIFHINELSTYALQILQESREGSVHSVYRNTVNIMVNGKLLAVQTANSPISPISLISNLKPDTDALEHFSCKKDERVHLEYADAKVYDLAPQHPITHLIRHELYKKFTRIITQSKTGGLELIFQISSKVDQDLVLSAAETKIHEVHKLYSRKQFQEAAEKLCELIGLGIGLTPSGDDFLCGILAGLHIQGIKSSEFADHLRNGIQNNLHRTNEISAAFLSCAMDGHFSHAVNELWNNPSTEQISKMFHKIGHSSGMDTLCGIYFLFFLME